MTRKISRIGVLLGDPSGIGPELVAKLLATPKLSSHASVLVIGDQRILEMGQDIAGEGKANPTAIQRAFSIVCQMAVNNIFSLTTERRNAL